MANEYLGLSLFIMLLSFFIILNALSDFEETKADPIVSSLNMAFSAGAVDKNEPAPSVISAEETSMNEGTTLDKIEGLFNAPVKNFKITKNRLGTEMYISLTREEFEKALGAKGQETFLQDSGSNPLMEEPFLNMLVDLMNTAQTNAPYHMDIVLNLGANPSVMRNEAPEKLNASMKTVSGYSELLEGQGLPIRFISVGVGAGAPDMVDLLFRPYKSLDVSGSIVDGERGD
tara:strand:+ start:128 stop:820 length:693 start_codon:yes stop_codon:yes gene_type:complete